jgi:anti-sigma factor RsiW
VLPVAPEPGTCRSVRGRFTAVYRVPLIVMMSMSVVPRMISCRWAALRLQRYLDRDPSGLLPDTDVQRLEAHLATCEKCQGLASQYRSLSGMLARLWLTCEPDAGTIERVQARLEFVLDEE